MTPAAEFVRLNADIERIYGHLTDDELRDFYRRGFIIRWVYEHLRTVRRLP